MADLRQLVRRRALSDFIKHKKWEKYLFQEDGGADERTPFERLFSQGSTLLNAMVLRQAQPYMYRLLMNHAVDNSLPRTAFHFDYANTGHFANLNADVIARILKFCGSRTIAESLAPSCLAFRLFITSKEFFREMCGEQFLDNMEIIFSEDEERKKKFFLAMEQVDAEALLSHISQVQGVLFSCPSDEYVVGTLTRMRLSHSLAAVKTCLSSRKRLTEFKDRIMEFHMSCDNLRENSPLSEMIGEILRIVQVVGGILNNNPVHEFSFQSLREFTSITSRFDDSFSALHQVLVLLVERYGRSTLEDKLVEIEWFFRVLCERFDSVTVPTIFHLFREMRVDLCSFESLLTQFVNAERSEEDESLHTQLRALFSILLGELESIKDSASRVQVRVEDTRRFYAKSAFDLGELSLFFSSLVQALEQDHPSLEAIVSRLDNTLELEEKALSEMEAQIARSIEENRRVLVDGSISEAEFAALRSRVETLFASRSYRSSDATVNRTREAREEISSIGLRLEELASRLDRWLTRRASRGMPHAVVTSSQAIQETSGFVDDHEVQEEKGEDIVESSSSSSENTPPNHLEDSKLPESSKNNGATVLKCKMWHYEREEGEKQAVWKVVISSWAPELDNHTEGKIRWVFSQGQNIYRTKTVQSSVTRKHFTLEDFGGVPRSIKKSTSFRKHALSRHKSSQTLRKDGAEVPGSNDGNKKGEAASASATDNNNNNNMEIFTYEQISTFQREGTTYKYGMDITKLEDYLTPAEFQRLFQMSKTEFYQLPRWRQINLKKNHKLF